MIKDDVIELIEYDIAYILHSVCIIPAYTNHYFLLPKFNVFALVIFDCNNCRNNVSKRYWF